MRRRMSDTILTVEQDAPRKRIASNGNKLPDPIREGEILTDLLGNRWKLGRSIGIGGFGEIYLASGEISKAVGTEAEHVVKVEPHRNGPLFVEMNFYIRAAKPEMILEWQRRKRLQHLGMSPYLGSGSHTYRGDKYRFLVLERYGPDLNKLFLKYKRKFHLKTVLYLGIQILDVLEYIHSQGYIHADIKGSNLLVGHQHGTTNNVYLLDYGLACRYIERNGRHKEYHSDLRKAHNGTIEYTSRDAHIGAHSRRGDLEILGYNLLQWLCSKLPWEDEQADPDYVHEQKKSYMSNIPLLMKHCFPDREAPAVISQYLKYVASLGFDTKPDYSYCRKLLRKGVTDAGYVDDGKLEFGLSVSPRMKQIKKKRNLEEPENIGLKPKKLFKSAHRQPCVAHNFNRMTRNSAAAPVLRSQQFSWEKVLSSHPEKKPQIARKHVVSSVTKLEVPKVRPIEPALRQEEIKTEEPGIPTPAMLEVIARMQERNSSQVIGVVRKTRSDSRCSSPSEESLYPFALTPAMEQVLRRREELQQQDIERQCRELRVACDNYESIEGMRVTRSGARRVPVSPNQLRRSKSVPLVDGSCSGTASAILSRTRKHWEESAKEITKRPATRGTKEGSLAILTLSPYKKSLEASRTATNKSEKKKQRQTKLRYQELSDSQDDGFNVSDDPFTLSSVPEKREPTYEDAACIFCLGKFSNDKEGEEWVMCLLCEMWGHTECAGYDKGPYVCDFCE